MRQSKQNRRGRHAGNIERLADKANEVELAPTHMVFDGVLAGPALVEAGQGATLLIHEATFEDDMLEHARKKKHSTTRFVHPAPCSRSVVRWRGLSTVVPRTRTRTLQWMPAWPFYPRAAVCECGVRVH